MKGMKVIDILLKNSSPVDVSFLVKKLKVNKTTVYRQLEKLIKENIVTEVELGEGKKRYELKSLGHHHHLVCDDCGKLEDVSFNEDILLKEVNKKSKFLIKSHNLEFFGLCVECR